MWPTYLKEFHLAGKDGALVIHVLMVILEAFDLDLETIDVALEAFGLDLETFDLDL